MTHFRRPLSIALGLGCAACAASATAPPAVPLPSSRQASLEEVLAAYEAYCKESETLSASGDLDVRDRRAGRSRKLGVRVVAARGGRLYLKGSVAVITALEVVADGQRFWFQVPSKKTVWTGPASSSARDAETADAPYYALRPSDVSSALLPECLSREDGDALVLDADPDSFSLTLARVQEGRGTTKRRVWLRRATLEPARLASYDARGDLESLVTWAEPKEGVPRRVAIRRPREGYEADFLFNKVERNVTVPSQAFVPRTPQGYTVVEVR